LSKRAADDGAKLPLKTIIIIFSLSDNASGIPARSEHRP
jgi:hypothetical protein